MEKVVAQFGSTLVPYFSRFDGIKMGWEEKNGKCSTAKGKGSSTLDTGQTTVP